MGNAEFDEKRQRKVIQQDELMKIIVSGPQKGHIGSVLRKMRKRGRGRASGVTQDGPQSKLASELKWSSSGKSRTPP